MHLRAFPRKALLQKASAFALSRIHESAVVMRLVRKKYQVLWLAEGDWRAAGVRVDQSQASGVLVGRHGPSIGRPASRATVLDMNRMIRLIHHRWQTLKMHGSVKVPDSNWSSKSTMRRPIHLTFLPSSRWPVLACLQREEFRVCRQLRPHGAAGPQSETRRRQWWMQVSRDSIALSYQTGGLDVGLFHSDL